MTRGEIDLQQSDDMDVLVVSDEALEEAACGGLVRGSPTLAYGSYCFACRPHFVSGIALDALIKRSRTDGDWII
jgi:hypothetical protein